jgi:hypothetical protein
VWLSLRRVLVLPIYLLAIITAIAIGASACSASATQLCNGISGADASQVKPLCSATWAMTATCTGEDLWDKWKIFDGRTKRPDAFIKPFEDVSVDVVGYELVNMSGRPASEFANAWFMIGSGMTGYPDAMLWLGPGEMHSRVMFPNGFGQHWPGVDVAKKSRLEDIIDLHGSCFGGKDVVVYLTVYYSPIAPAESRPVSR